MLPSLIEATRHRVLRAALATSLLVAVMGCTGYQKEDPTKEFADQSVEQIYNTAMDRMAEGRYESAAKAFEEVDRQHPYSQWATRAQIMTAFAYYQANKYDEAISAAERYIELHPGASDTPYAYYLIGTCYYEQISDTGRDQEMTKQALTSFEELIKRYPDTPYARDAELKVDLTHDHLAGKEMEIGRFYQWRREYVGAINRYRSVVEKYQTTTHVPEALYRLTESYLALGVPTEAQSAAAVLGYNYPGSEWYEKAYVLLGNKGLQPAEDQGSWLSRLF